MTVIAFQSKLLQRDRPWRSGELEAIVDNLAPELGGGEAGEWDVGVTELGDPQFYLLGPPPHDECMLCISRLGRIYVLEDGAGRVLLEHNSLMVLAEQARSLVRRKKDADRRSCRADLVRAARKLRGEARGGHGRERRAAHACRAAACGAGVTLAKTAAGWRPIRTAAGVPQVSGYLPGSKTRHCAGSGT